MALNARSAWLSGASGLGLLAVFLGERVAAPGLPRGILSGAGVALAVAAMGLRIGRTSVPEPGRRRVERLLLVFQALAVAALVVWFAGSDALAAVGGPDLSRGAPRLVTALRVLCAVLSVGSIVPLALAELAYASMARAPHVEEGRVRDAALSGVGLAAVLVGVFALGWVAEVRDARVDLSYFRTTRPSAATRALVRGLTDSVTIATFYPPANDVGYQVLEYLHDLARESPKLQIERYDQAVDIARARALSASGNGTVVVARGGRKELIFTGVELDQARGDLRNLDAEVQKRLSAVARPRKVVYFTAGHGERTEQNENTLDARGTIRGFEDLLRADNDEVRPLGSAEGLASDVPRDAGAIAVIGPTRAFLPEEVQSLTRYLRSGGRMLIALDPERGQNFDALLQPLGLRFDPAVLANDRIYYPLAHQPSDRSVLVTATYSAHPSVSTLSRLATQAPLVVLGAGSLEVLKQKPTETVVDFTVLALRDTYRKLDEGWTFDPRTEKRRAWELVAAVTLSRKGAEDGRAVVAADSDLLTDAVLDSNLGNRTFALDSVRWLVGDQITGAPSSELDVPVEHTRGEEAGWFYATVFAAPALVLAAGFALNRSRRRRAR